MSVNLAQRSIPLGGTASGSISKAAEILTHSLYICTSTRVDAQTGFVFNLFCGKYDARVSVIGESCVNGNDVFVKCLQNLWGYANTVRSTLP